MWLKSSSPSFNSHDCMHSKLALFMPVNIHQAAVGSFETRPGKHSSYSHDNEYNEWHTKLASGPRRLTVWASGQYGLPSALWRCPRRPQSTASLDRGIHMVRTNTLHTPCIYSRKIHSPAFHNITGIARRLLVRC